jgi:hypothetical protein
MQNEGQLRARGYENVPGYDITDLSRNSRPNYYGHPALTGYLGSTHEIVNQRVLTSLQSSELNQTVPGIGEFATKLFQNPAYGLFPAQDPLTRIEGSLRQLDVLLPTAMVGIGGSGSIGLGLQNVLALTGGNPLAADLQRLGGTGLIDASLMNAITNGSGGFSFQPASTSAMPPVYVSQVAPAGNDLASLLNQANSTTATFLRQAASTPASKAVSSTPTTVKTTTVQPGTPAATQTVKPASTANKPAVAKPASTPSKLAAKTSTKSTTTTSSKTQTTATKSTLAQTVMNALKNITVSSQSKPVTISFHTFG